MVMSEESLPVFEQVPDDDHIDDKHGQKSDGMIVLGLWPANQFKNFNRDEKGRSPIASQIATSREMPAPDPGQTETVHRETCLMPARAHGWCDRVQPVADVAEKPIFRVEMHPPQELIKQLFQVLSCQRENSQCSEQQNQTLEILMPLMRYNIGARFFEAVGVFAF